jgi:ribosomal protein S27E
MAIKVMCPRCQNPFSADHDMAGTKVSCPHCGAGVAVPVPGAAIKTSKGTVYNPAVGAAHKSQVQRRRFSSGSAESPLKSGPGKYIVIGVAVLFMLFATVYINSRGGGKSNRSRSSLAPRAASAGDLHGRWKHEGDNLIVVITFKPDGTYDRSPKGFELVGAGIGEAGKWHIDGDNCLIFNPSGGSYIPTIQRDKLSLKGQLNGVVYQFTRN